MLNKPVRMLNHVETVYRPGERAVAQAMFELLGCWVSEAGGFLFAVIDRDTGNGIDNAVYSSEVTPEQWAFESALETGYVESPSLSAAVALYHEQMAKKPQHVFHFGIAVATPEMWEDMVARIDEAGRSDPVLAGRVSVAPFRPGDEGSFGPQLQAFVHTDAFSSGLLSLGQQIEIQWTPDSVYEGIARRWAKEAEQP